MLYGMKLNISNLQAFSAPCTIVQASVKLKKFDDRVTMCLFLGYKYSSGGYRVWHPERRVVVEARDVIFFEDGLLTSPLHMSTQDNDLIIQQLTEHPNNPVLSVMNQPGKPAEVPTPLTTTPMTQQPMPTLELQKCLVI